MRRYLVFAGDKFYPSGGWADFIWSYATLSAALDKLITGGYDWGQIVDSRTWKIVKKYERGTNGNR